MRPVKLLLLIALFACFSCAALLAQSNSGNGNRSGNDNRYTIKLGVPNAKLGGQNAKIKSKPSAAYPPEANEYKVSAVVKLKMILSSSGEVTNIRKLKVTVPEGVPDEVADAFVREAIKAAGKITFEPAMKDGRPVSQIIFVEYSFTPQ
jgi:outer membrane biosynthesis protein TonB